MSCYTGPVTPYTQLRDLSAGCFYNPRNLKSLFQDLDGTVPAQVDSVVNLMKDSGPLKLHMKATSGYPPYLRYANKSYYLEFDGVHMEMITDYSSLFPSITDTGGAMTICVAAKWTGSSSQVTFLGHNAIGNYNNCWLFGPRIISPGHYCYYYDTTWKGVFSASNYQALTDIVNTPYIYVMQGTVNSTTTTGKSWLNGVIRDDFNTSGVINLSYYPKPNTGQFVIGTRHYANNGWGSGNFYGGAVFGKLLTDTERKIIEDFLRLNIYG